MTLMVGCFDTVHENAVGYCEDVKANDRCNDEMTAVEVWKECPKTCGCGKQNQ